MHGIPGQHHPEMVNYLPLHRAFSLIFKIEFELKYNFDLTVYPDFYLILFFRNQLLPVNNLNKSWILHSGRLDNAVPVSFCIQERDIESETGNIHGFPQNISAVGIHLFHNLFDIIDPDYN